MRNFCRLLKSGRNVTPETPFERTYYRSYLYKKYFRYKTKQQKLAELRNLATIVVDNNVKFYKKRRQRKHRSRKLCFVCKRYHCTYQHHIILLVNGGSDTGMNRIPCCNNCHKSIHPWLKKIEV